MVLCSKQDKNSVNWGPNSTIYHPVFFYLLASYPGSFFACEKQKWAWGWSYRIVGNFRGRKLLRIGKKKKIFTEKLSQRNFHRLLAFATPKDTTPQNFAEKTFTNSHKTLNFAKVFSTKIVFFTNSQKFPPSKISRYTVFICDVGSRTVHCTVKELFVLMCGCFSCSALSSVTFWCTGSTFWSMCCASVGSRTPSVVSRCSPELLLPPSSLDCTSTDGAHTHIFVFYVWVY